MGFFFLLSLWFWRRQYIRMMFALQVLNIFPVFKLKYYHSNISESINQEDAAFRNKSILNLKKFVWKSLFLISKTNRFLTFDWIPFSKMLCLWWLWKGEFLAAVIDHRLRDANIIVSNKSIPHDPFTKTAKKICSLRTIVHFCELNWLPASF